MPLSLLFIGFGTIVTATVVMLGGSFRVDTNVYIALGLAIIYASAMWDAWFSRGRFKVVREWALRNKSKFIRMSTIDSFYFWAVLILAASVFISGWFLLVGALANMIFCHANRIDVLGPAPESEHIELD